MARLGTWGFEVQVIATSPALEGVCSSVSCTRDTSFKRSGAASLKSDSTGSNFAAVNQQKLVPPTVSATNYHRAFICFNDLPGATIPVIRFGDAVNRISGRLTSAGKLQLWNDTAATQIGSDSSATISADATTWYRLELGCTLNATPQITACELRLNGVSVASTSGLTLAVTLANCQFESGWVTAPGANKVCHVDDCAVNDSTGSNQNSWLGDGSVVLLVPTADSAVGSGWTLGTGTAIAANSGSTAVKNIPPLGVADLAAGSDPKQIRNAGSFANSNYDATMTTYTAAGIGAGATINVVEPITATAAPVSTSAKAGTVGVVSNPAITNINLGAGGTAGAFWSGTTAGTFAAGWKWSRGTITMAPSVTLGTAPVMRITQVTASTRIAMVCFMGIYVDYTPTSGSTYAKAGYAKESA